MTNEQLYLLFAGQVVTILAVFLASLLGGRGITREIALTNKRIDDTNKRIDDLRQEMIGRLNDLRQEITGRLDTLTGELRQAIQYLREDLEKRK